MWYNVYIYHNHYRRPFRLCEFHRFNKNDDIKTRYTQLILITYTCILWLLCFDAETFWSLPPSQIQTLLVYTYTTTFPPLPLTHHIHRHLRAIPPPNFIARLTPCVTYILGVCLTLAWRGATASAVMVVSTGRYYTTTILIRSNVTVGYIYRYTHSIC